MSRNGNEYRVGVGASSVLMIMVVLALTAVSLLALSSARSTEALAQRGQAMTVAYYEAAGDAQLRLMAADQWLIAARQSAADEAAYQQALADTLPAGLTRTPAGFAFAVDAGEGRTLAVEADILPYAQTGARYRITRHQLVNQPWDEGEAYYTLIGE